MGALREAVEGLLGKLAAQLPAGKPQMVFKINNYHQVLLTLEKRGSVDADGAGGVSGSADGARFEELLSEQRELYVSGLNRWVVARARACVCVCVLRDGGSAALQQQQQHASRRGAVCCTGVRSVRLGSSGLLLGWRFVLFVYGTLLPPPLSPCPSSVGLRAATSRRRCRSRRAAVP
jgi:hypothetical protein